MSPKTITGDVFKHRKELSQDDFKDLLVDGGTDKIRTLLTSKWKVVPEEIIAVPCLTVNNVDRLSGARWCVMGNIGKDINIKLQQLNTEAEEDIYVTIKNLDTAVFSFYNKRRNVSGWIDSSTIEFSLFKKVNNKKQVIHADKYVEHGMLGFSLRLGVLPVNPNTASLTLALLPLSKENIKAKLPDHYTKTSCPEVALLIGSNNAKYTHIKMGIEEPVTSKVGMGIWPVVEDIRTEEEAAGIYPTSMETRKALHSFMRSCKGLNNKTAKKVMEALLDLEELNKSIDPEFIWPEAADVESDEPFDELGKWHDVQ